MFVLLPKYYVSYIIGRSCITLGKKRIEKNSGTRWGWAVPSSSKSQLAINN